MIDPLYVFVALLVVIGPWKAAIVFAERTTPMAKPQRRQTAVYTTLIGTIVALAMLFFGWALVELFKIDAAAFLIAAGLIVLVFAVRMVISDSDHADESHGDEDVSPLSLAIYPLSVPLLVTPPAIATLTALGTEVALDDSALIDVALAVLIVMAINLGVFLALAATEDRINRGVWEVGGRVLGVFLAAFGASIIIEGLKLLDVIKGASG